MLFNDGARIVLADDDEDVDPEEDDEDEDDGRDDSSCCASASRLRFSSHQYTLLVPVNPLNSSSVTTGTSDSGSLERKYLDFGSRE